MNEIIMADWRRESVHTIIINLYGDVNCTFSLERFKNAFVIMHTIIAILLAHEHLFESPSHSHSFNVGYKP